ncbi:muscle, skeletal receptor tyrosine-protein kinase-like [Patiria miniata]|uniref:Protein kinase domain-containing protein n=1 Tax=Patiria miniata TaxID=46514 RepID=A0A914B5R6_PATMI|nr:muscle, skeletal receptor tyrosine-protein kinase-like [Patiria miniata]
MIQSHIWVVIVATSLAVLTPKIGITSANTCITLPSATNLNLTFQTRRDTSGPGLGGSGDKWTLDAVGSWQRPAGIFTGYGAKLSTVPSSNHPELNPCAIDSTLYTLTTNESITFPDVDFGYAYELRVRTYDDSNNIMQRPQSGSHIEPINSPDCYEETKSAAFCSGRAVQTTGKPVDLRIDRTIRQINGVIEVNASWVRPVQSNGAIKMYVVSYKQPNKPITTSNGHKDYIPAAQEDGEWNLTVRYEITMDLPESTDDLYELTVTPVTDDTTSLYQARILFETAGAEEPSPAETRIESALDSWIPEADPTPPPRRAPDGRGLPSNDDVTKGATTSPSSGLDKSTTPTSEGDIPPTPGKPASSSILVTASVAVGAALAFLLSMVCVACICLRRKKKEDELKKAVFIRTREEEISMYHHKGSLEKNETDYKECLPEFEVKELDRTLLKLEKELGSGQFGVVYKGFAFGAYNKEEYSPVAVKSLKCNASLAMKEDFLDEIKLIIEIGTHPNILSVLGCCTVDEPYYLITEFMKYGDLLHFLWKCREENRPDDDVIYLLSETNKIQIARQITRGMEYLSNTRYYHGDLAARNVLVGEDLVIKISDFGLADDIYQNGYKRLAPQRKRPVKWVSLETNMEGKCTIQSDVWSFGIVLYEIYTLGSMPYPGVDGREVIRRLQTGYRMDKPNSCPEDIYDIMRQCWREKPCDRPTFTNLFNTFDKMLVAQCDYMPLEGAVYDHCIPTTGGSGGIKARSEKGEASGAMATGSKLTLNEEEMAKSDPEQSDTARLFQKDEIED